MAHAVTGRPFPEAPPDPCGPWSSRVPTLYERRSGRFYDPWEETGPAERRRVIRRRLADYVAHARRRSPFYRKRLSAYDPGLEHPLAGVRPLNPDEARSRLPPAGSGLAVSSEGWNVFQSGGTTGMPKTTLFSREELEALSFPNARGFYACGLKPSDRVANLFAVGGLYMTFLHIHRMLEGYGCMNFPFSNHTPPDFVASVARHFRINCVAGISSVALHFLRSAAAGDGGRRGRSARGGAGRLRIEKLYYGGEHMYEADMEEVRKAFGTRVIKAPGYGTVDTWYIGYQCLRTPTGVFHAHDDQTYIEIVDEETGRPCPAPLPGMLCATPFPRRLTPVVRYRVGDRALWTGRPCPCGRTTPLFKLLGRGDDVLRIGFDSVDYAFVQEAVARVPGLTGTVQMEKRRQGGRDLLILRVETAASAGRRASLARRLLREVVDGRPSLRKFVAERTVWPPRVELLAPGSLPRNPRTGKLIRVIDCVA